MSNTDVSNQVKKEATSCCLGCKHLHTTTNENGIYKIHHRCNEGKFILEQHTSNPEIPDVQTCNLFSAAPKAKSLNEEKKA